MLVILVVLGLFLLWLGTALLKIHRGYAILSYSFSVLILVLSIGGFFGLI